MACGIAQNARCMILESFSLLMEEYGISPEELYELSPPPTRILLDLVSRQIDERNDDLYASMREYNPFIDKITDLITRNLSERKKDTPRRIRSLFKGNYLRESQERARKLIEEK